MHVAPYRNPHAPHHNLQLQLSFSFDVAFLSLVVALQNEKSYAALFKTLSNRYMILKIMEIKES